MAVLNAANVSCRCDCESFRALQSMEITQLEFVQILVILVVMVVMVVVITCLLNHYRLSASSFLSRHTNTQRRHRPLANEGGLWSSEGRNGGLNERVVFPRPPLLELPPSIGLSDGEEPPPYVGPCSLQLRDREQQGELNRESVRPPPNRTVYDSLQSLHVFDHSLAPPTYSEAVGHFGLPASSIIPGLIRPPPRNGKEKSQNPQRV